MARQLRSKALSSRTGPPQQRPAPAATSDAKKRRDAENSSTDAVKKPAGSADAKENAAKMDRYAQDNRANQRNTNHTATGSGRNSGYQGSRANENNRANQLNPNHPSYKGKK